jgi:uncharacterized membrane-anchored protein YitT (DUF2179 family)
MEKKKNVTTGEILLIIALFFLVAGLFFLTKNLSASILIASGYMLSVSRLKRTS